jgi:citrate synthase
MNAAVSKTRIQNLLPTGLAVAGGEFLGAGEVENSVRFIRRHINKAPQQVAQDLLAEYAPDSNTNTVIAPGFGARFGTIDRVSSQLATQLLQLEGSSTALAWADEFCQALKVQQLGWLVSGLAAASFADLGFSPAASAGIFQIAIAPGMLAHGLEMANKPLTAMPFVEDANYIHVGENDD